MWMQSRQRCLMDLSNLLKVLGTDKHYLDLQLRASRAVVRLQHIGQRSLYKNWSKNSKKNVGCNSIFLAVNVFHSFFAFRLEMHVRCDNQYKTGADRGKILGQPRLFECVGISVLSPAHESELRGYLVYVLIVKYLSHRFC